MTNKTLCRDFPGFAIIRDCVFREVVAGDNTVKYMTQESANEDQQLRRAKARRTAYIVGAVALALYVLFFLKQGFWH